MKKGILLGLCIMILLSIAVIAAPSQTPHGIKGYIHQSGGSQVSSGTSFTVNNTATGHVVSGVTGAPGNTGWYSVSVNGTDGDLVIVSTSGDPYAWRLVTLQGDMSDINVTENIDSNAPVLDALRDDGTKGVWISPENPANNTDLVCNVEGASDPNADAITLDYTWYKNGVAQGDSLHELQIEDDTLFLARYDSDVNATFARGDGNATYFGTNINSGKIGNSLNFSQAGDRLNYSSVGNINVTQGTLQFWIKPHTLSGNQGVFQIWRDDANQVSFYLVANNLYYLYGNTILLHPVTWSTHEWHHVAMTWGTRSEGGGTKSFHNLYADGLLVKSTVSAQTASLDYSQYPIAIGYSYKTGFNLLMDCSIDDLRISSKELSNMEIWEDYSESVIRRQKISSDDAWSCKIQPDDGTNDGNEILSDNFTIANYSISYKLFDGTTNYLNETLKAGKPTGMEVSVTNNGAAVADAIIEVNEANGYGSFAYPQTYDTFAESNQILKTKTDQNGLVNVSFIPTGGRKSDTVNNDDLNIINQGVNYTIALTVKVGDSTVYSKNLKIGQSSRYTLGSYYRASYAVSDVPNNEDIKQAASENVYENIYGIYSKIRYFIGDSGFG